MLLAYCPQHFQTDAFELFFETPLVLDVKTTFRLQKTCCEDF